MSSELVRLLSRLESRNQITLQGFRGVFLAQELLTQVMRHGKYRIVLDPQSEAEVLDLLALPLASSLQGATAGAGIGAVLSVLFREPRLALVGMFLGLLFGGATGIKQVRRGLRIRAVQNSRGEPVVTLLPE